MAAKKAAKKSASKKAAAPAPKPDKSKTEAAPTTAAPDKTEEVITADPPQPEVEPAASGAPDPGVPPAFVPDPAGATTPDAGAGEAPVASKSGGKAAITVAEFVLKLLLKHFTPPVAESWCAKVVQAVEEDKIVTIADAKGSPLLEIHDTFRYQDRDSVRTLAARYGKKFQVNINQLVRDKFPQE